jgi:peroxiredoxin
MLKEELNWRTFVDRGAIAERWKPAGTPTFYIIDSRGVIRHRWGGVPGEKAMDAALEKLIQEAEGDGGKSRG